ncbi:hypothetical protein [Priestia megaterium]|uniref:hypothetical protein n=1 Tax=Priestia megaterium TaxID=1404 RepID=UPI0012B735D3|nr:hypothetical protein [Priestia megaterium]
MRTDICHSLEFTYKMVDHAGRIILSPKIIQGFKLEPGEFLAFTTFKHYIILTKKDKDLFKRDLMTAGFLRKLHKIGRITIPLEIREMFNIEQYQELHIRLFRNCIVLNKSEDDSKDNDEDLQFILNEIEGSTKGNKFVHRQIKDNGKVQLTDEILSILGFTRKSEIQFFLKDNMLAIREFDFDVKAPVGMQYTGQSRKIDHLVRLDIPKKLREKLKIMPNNYVTFIVKEDFIYISVTHFKGE